MDRYGTSASSWWMITMPRCSLARMSLNGAGLALEEDLALVAAVRVDAAEHLHQGRLAGAVLAADGVDLALRGRSDVTSESALTPGKVLVIERISRTGPAMVVPSNPTGRGGYLSCVCGVVAVVDEHLLVVGLVDADRLAAGRPARPSCRCRTVLVSLTSGFLPFSTASTICTAALASLRVSL